MITAKTSSGFEIELDENIFRKDTELTEAIVFLDTDESGKCLFTAINHLLGPEGKKRLYEHLRTPEGTVALDDLAKAFGELVSCIKDGKKLCILADLIASDEDALICDFCAVLPCAGLADPAAASGCHPCRRSAGEQPLYAQAFRPDRAA